MSIFDPIDELFGVTGKDPAEGLTKQANLEFKSLHAPSPEELMVTLQKMVYAGDITPEMAQTVLQDPSKFSDIVGSPEGRSAQLQALSELQGIGKEGGLDPESRAAISDVQSRAAQAERGSREAILQNARERGAGGSGFELAAQLENQQGSAGRASQAGLDIAGQARQRALQAIQESGKLGGQIEGQQFGEEAAKASAADAINKFNTQNSQATIMANIAAKNAAQARNVETHQAIEGKNTDTANEQAKINAQAHQTAYEDALKKAAGASGTLKDAATGSRDAANQKLAFEGGLINTIGSVASAASRGPKPPALAVAAKPKDEEYDWQHDPMFA